MSPLGLFGNKKAALAFFPLAILALLFVTGGGKDPVWYSILCGTVFLVFLATVFVKKEIPKTPLTVSLCALFLWSWVPLLTNVPIDYHLLGLSKLGLSLSFLLIISLGGDEIIEKFKRLVAILALIESIWVIARFANEGIGIGGLSGNSLYSALLIGSGLLLLWTDSVKRPYVPRWPLGALCLMALFMTQSRGVLLGLLAAGTFVADKKNLRRIFLAATITLTAFLVFGPENLLERLKLDIFNPNTTAWARLMIWKTAILAIAHHGLLGWGYGNFEAAYLQFQQPSQSILRYSETTAFAHNDSLQLAVSVGIPGLLILLWGIVKSKPYFKEWRQGARTRGPFAVLVMYVVCSFFNFCFYLPINALVAAGCLGCLMTKELRSPRVYFQRSFVLSFSGLMLFLTLFNAARGISFYWEDRNNLTQALSWAPWRSELWYEQAMDKLRSAQPNQSPRTEQKKEALALIQKSLRWNPHNAYYWNRQGIILGTMEDSTFEEIAIAFNNAHRLAPFHAPFFVDEGFARLQKNDVRNAEDCFSKAAALEPFAPLPVAGMALAAHLEGRKKDAKSMFQAAQRLKTDYGHLVLPSDYSNYLFNVSSNGLL